MVCESLFDVIKCAVITPKTCNEHLVKAATKSKENMHHETPQNEYVYE